MIKLVTKCENCIHRNVCRNCDQPKYFADRLSKNNYGNGSNDDYDFVTMSEHYHVNIDISCEDYKQNVPKPRKAF